MENEIKLNGEDYVLKSSIVNKKNEIESYTNGYNQKTYLKLLNSLSKLLTITSCPMPQDIAFEKERLNVMDAANVLLVVAKSKRAKDILRMCVYYDDYEYQKPVALDFVNEGEHSSSKFSVDYIKKIISFFSFLDDNGSVCVAVSKDFPSLYANEDWEFILAPRVDNEDSYVSEIRNFYKKKETKEDKD